jgi:hypothetical protein
LLALEKAVMALQSQLNQCLQLQVHVEIVQGVLAMPAQQSLKANTLSLLLEKINTFSQGWLSKVANGTFSVFKALVARAVELLQETIPSELA